MWSALRGKRSISRSAKRARPSTRDRLINDGLPQAMQWPLRLSLITSQLAHNTAFCSVMRFTGKQYSTAFCITTSPRERGLSCNRWATAEGGHVADKASVGLRMEVKGAGSWARPGPYGVKAFATW